MLIVNTDFKKGLHCLGKDVDFLVVVWFTITKFAAIAATISLQQQTILSAIQK